MKQKPRIEKDVFIKLMTFVKTWFKHNEAKSKNIADVLYHKDMFISKRDLEFTIEDLISDPEAKDIIIDIIVDAMNDSTNEWIYYYIYELDWGEENDKLKVYDKDGVTEIPLRTLEDLWNVLTSDEKVL